MVQIIPQDVPAGTRFAQALLPPIGEGFGQGFGDISKQMVQQQIREELAERATKKLGPDVQQSVKDIFLAQSMMGQQPDFSRALGIMINKEAQNEWNNLPQNQRNLTGPPSSIKEDQIAENPEIQPAYPNYEPGPYRPPEEPPLDQNKIELPGFQTQMQQPAAGEMPQFGEGLQSFRGGLPYDPQIARRTYPYAQEITKFEMEMARNVPIEQYSHPAQVKAAEQAYYDTLMEPFRGYLDREVDGQKNGIHTESFLKPALLSLAQKNRTGNLPKDQANFIRESQQLLRNVDAITDAKNDFPDIAFNPNNADKFRTAAQPAIDNLVNLGLEDFARKQLADYLPNPLLIESLVRKVPDRIIDNNKKYAKNNNEILKRRTKKGFGQAGVIGAPKIRELSDETIAKQGENLAKIWESYVKDGGSLFSMWHHVSGENVPDSVMRNAVSHLQKSIRFNSDQRREMGKINSAPNDYWRDQHMRNRLTGPQANNWYMFLNFLKGRSNESQ